MRYCRQGTCTRKYGRYAGEEENVTAVREAAESICGEVVMAIHGEVYTTIKAEAVNPGIRTMAISGQTDVIGNETLTVVIHWSYDPNSGTGGITGVSWYIGEDYSPIPAEMGYTSDEDLNNYLKQLSTDEIINTITNYMEMWIPEQKSAFWNAQRSETYGCLDLIIS